MIKRLKSLRNLNKNLFPLIAIMLGLAVMTAACVPGRPTPSTAPPPEAETLIQMLRQRQAQMKSFAGRGSMQFKSPGYNYHFDIMTASIRPNQVRLQAYDPLGRPALTMAANQKELSSLDYREAILYQGPATAENFGRFLPLGLGISDVITLFAGSPPMTPHIRATVKAKRLDNQDVWLLSLFKSGGRYVQRIWLTTTGSRALKAEIGPIDGKAILTFAFSSFQEQGGLAVPTIIQMSDIQEDAELIIKYQEIKVNPDLPENTFSIPTPPGVQVEPLPGPQVGPAPTEDNQMLTKATEEPTTLQETEEAIH